MTKELISEVVQAVLAVVIVAGTVYAIITGNPNATGLTPLSTLVLGFYFGKTIPTVLTLSAKTDGVIE